MTGDDFADRNIAQFRAGSIPRFGAGGRLVTPNSLSILGVAGLCFLAVPATADPSTLIGNSIRIHRVEEVQSFGGTFTVTWDDLIYVSTANRIFHRMNIKSSQAAARGEGDLLSGENRAAFLFDGDALVRRWRNPRNGVWFVQRVSLVGQRQCNSDIIRLNVPVQPRLLNSTCEVVPGNLLSQ